MSGALGVRGGPKWVPSYGQRGHLALSTNCFAQQLSHCVPLFLPTQTAVIYLFLMSGKMMLEEQLTGLFETWLVGDECHGTDRSVYYKGKERLLCLLLYDGGCCKGERYLPVISICTTQS